MREPLWKWEGENRGGQLLKELLSDCISRGGRLSPGSECCSILDEQDITQNTRQVSLSLWLTRSSLDNRKMMEIDLHCKNSKHQRVNRKGTNLPWSLEVIAIVHFICLSKLFKAFIDIYVYIGSYSKTVLQGFFFHLLDIWNMSVHIEPAHVCYMLVVIPQSAHIKNDLTNVLLIEM